MDNKRLRKLAGIESLQEAGDDNQKKALQEVKKKSAAAAKKEARLETAWVKAVAERAIWGEVEGIIEFSSDPEDSPQDMIKNALPEAKESLKRVGGILNILDEDNLSVQLINASRKIK